MAYGSTLVALADPTRRGVYERLRKRPHTVGELARLAHVSQPAISQHLRVLTDAKLVTHEREGTRRNYRASRDGLDELRRYIETLWDDVSPPTPRPIPRRPMRRPGRKDDHGHAQSAADRRLHLGIGTPRPRSRQFTADFGAWWPRTHPSAAGAGRVVFEGRAGGLIFEEHVDRRRFQWGKVLEWNSRGACASPGTRRATGDGAGRGGCASCPRTEARASGSCRAAGRVGPGAPRAQGLPRRLGLRAQRMGAAPHRGHGGARRSRGGGCRAVVRGGTGAAIARAGGGIEAEAGPRSEPAGARREGRMTRRSASATGIASNRMAPLWKSARGAAPPGDGSAAAEGAGGP
jgi:DNA-binding transcriptional ArsR family regulator